MTMPTLFVSHGNPLTLEQDARMTEWQQWGSHLPRPKAILIFSAHWECAPLTLGTTSSRPLIYDFYGFPEHYYRIPYAAPGAPALAERVSDLLQEAGVPVARRPERGWDHGVWVPLLGMFPAADIPLLQVSLPSSDPQQLLALGKLLAPLRDEGVLIVTSGVITHNLRQWTDDGVVAPWAQAFDDWVAARLQARDITGLLDYRHAPGAAQSVPTPEHFVPLFINLGACQPDEAISFPVEGFEFGSFSHRSVQFGTSDQHPL